MTTAATATTAAPAATAALPAAGRIGMIAGVTAQLALAVAVAFAYEIENPAFLRVFALAAAGFVVHAVLRPALRLPWFVVLSLGGLAVVFRPADALWLLVTGVLLIGLARLPVSGRVRTLVLLAAGAALAGARAGLVAAPWSAAVWPILGSMFMFRLVLYVMSLRTEAPEKRGWWALAYFFMLPNLVFPLFPVIDYQTFRRTYFDRPEGEIYELGLMWIVRGLGHLLLYRFVYQNVIGDAESIVTLGDLAQFMLATFLLYLRVSGQFHLIVGLLHLFGFRLPETHKLYYLAHSFTELWRRINIYWTDFMMKTVFYPTYFKVKHLPPARALLISTSAVFVVTWLLHSYQWFWLRGGFPLTLQDTAFWAVLGALVVSGGLRDLKAGRRARVPAGAWNTSRGLRAAATFAAFCTLWSLWSTESVPLWLWMLGAASNVDVKGLLLIGGTLGLVFTLGGWDWQGRVPAARGWARMLFSQPVRIVGTLTLLLALSQPAVQAATPAPIARALASLQSSGLNARDLARQHRGYYEQLDVRAQLDAPVTAGGVREADWQDFPQLGILHDRKDILVRSMDASRSVMWNGKPFTTNEWGMRDRSYPKAKPDGTVRIALLGPSHVMGHGVGDDETFDHLVEARLNTAFAAAGVRVEVLNFGVFGYALPQQLALLDTLAWDFAPDIVIATHHRDSRELATGFIVLVVDRELSLPDGPVKQLLGEAGLLTSRVGGVPLPTEWARSLAGRFGLRTRIPFGELQARAHQVSEPLLAASFRRFADDVRSHHASPAVMYLNGGVFDTGRDVPQRWAMEAAGLPLIDLSGAYQARPGVALGVAPWDDHPNAAAHQQIADDLFAPLSDLVRSSLTATRTATVR